jgi:phospholipid-binding lipoprotein MlaA
MSGPFLLAALLVTCGPGVPENQPDIAIGQAFAAPGITVEPTENCASTSTQSVEPASQPAAQEDAAPGEEAEAIVVTAGRHAPKSDPLQGVNLQTFAVAQAVDGTLIKPTAMAYAKTVPEPARMGIRNFFRNLHEPVVALNFLLQLKPGKALKTLGRFAVNSTIGGAGLFDMAKKKPFNLPYRSNGFANTLAYYGVKPGPFLYLPLIGPTTARDLFGLALDTTAMPTSGLAPITGRVYAASSMAAKTVDARSENDDGLNAVIDSNPHGYSTIREAYLAKREAEIAELHRPSEPKRTELAMAGEASPPSD